MRASLILSRYLLTQNECKRYITDYKRKFDNIEDAKIIRPRSEDGRGK